MIYLHPSRPWEIFCITNSPITVLQASSWSYSNQFGPPREIGPIYTTKEDQIENLLGINASISATYIGDLSIGSSNRFRYQFANLSEDKDHVLSGISFESVTFSLMWRPLDIKHCLTFLGVHGYSRSLPSVFPEQVASSNW